MRFMGSNFNQYREKLRQFHDPCPECIGSDRLHSQDIFLNSAMDTENQWSDPVAWDAYHRRHVPDLERVEKYDLEQDLRYFQLLDGTVERSIWFPGCGLGLAPWLYANLGCKVVATDISPFAVELQNERLYEDPMEALEKLPNVLKEMDLPKAAHFVHPAIFVHDLCKPLARPPVDVIVATDVLQGFGSADLQKVAKVMCEALKAGGTLVCELPNLPFLHRNAIEAALLDAGFFLQGLRAEHWLREQLLRSEGRFAMHLGNPVLARQGSHPSSESQKQDEEALAAFRLAYQGKKSRMRWRTKRISASAWTNWPLCNTRHTELLRSASRQLSNRIKKVMGSEFVLNLAA